MYIFDNVYSSYSIDDIWNIISIVIALTAGICLFFTVFSKNNKNKYTGILKNVYDFINFDKLIISDLLKLMYIITVIYITLISFTYISYSFLEFIFVLVIGNIILRAIYEFILIIIKIYENTKKSK